MLIVFQITVGEVHPVKENGIRDIIKAYSKLVQDKMTQKLVVFVIPMHGPLCSEQPLHTVDDKVMERIPKELEGLEQYVCEYKLKA